MAGPSNDSSPDPVPSIWLCQDGSDRGSDKPAWLTTSEQATLSQLTGLRRKEYLLSRWLIRQALARSGLHPIDDCRPVCGRPVRSESPEGWCLSLSHSQGLAACATSPGLPVGVDLEPIKRHARWQAITRRWFTEREQAWLLAENDPLNFLKVWTLKEAWLKATGRGIAGNLQTLEVLPGFELVGDQQEPDWQACCFQLAKCFVTLVWKHASASNPRLHQVDSPCTLKRLSLAQYLTPESSVAVRQPIRPSETTKE